MDSEVHMHDRGMIKDQWRAQKWSVRANKAWPEEAMLSKVNHTTVSSCWDEIKVVIWQLLISSPKILVHGYNRERIFHQFLVRSSREQTSKRQYKFDICRASKSLSKFLLTWAGLDKSSFTFILIKLADDCPGPDTTCLASNNEKFLSQQENLLFLGLTYDFTWWHLLKPFLSFSNAEAHHKHQWIPNHYDNMSYCCISWP